MKNEILQVFWIWILMRRISRVSKIFGVTRRFCILSGSLTCFGPFLVIGLNFWWIVWLTLNFQQNLFRPSVHAKIESDLEWAGLSGNFNFSSCCRVALSYYFQREEMIYKTPRSILTKKLFPRDLDPRGQGCIQPNLNPINCHFSFSLFIDFESLS
jgi:hypothetical protein